MEGKPRKVAGRRPGKSGTKDSILEAAQKKFAELGYERTTIRLVAQDAKVDSALVLHYFQTKHELFLAAMLPFYEGPQLLAGVLQELKPADFGSRMAELFCRVMETESTQKMLLIMVRAATSEPNAAEALRSFIETRLILPIADFLAIDQANLKAGVLGSHLVGLFLTRYIVGVEPLASSSTEELVAILAPLFQHYLD